MLERGVFHHRRALRRWRRDSARIGAIVDALLGTGFEGEPRGAVAEAIDAANACGAPVVSVDVPSGVDASTGVVWRRRAVRAAITVTFHAAKPGLWIHPGKAHAGEVRTLDIGIPRGAPAAADIGLIEGAVLRELPAPRRRLDEVLKRPRGRRRRLARPHRAPAHGRPR